MPARKFTDEQEQEIARRYEAGESTPQLGKAYGSSSTAIGNVLKRWGVKRRSIGEAMTGRPRPSLRKFTDEQEQEICRRYLAGENSVQLGAVFGVSAWAISCILERGGIKRRSMSEANRALSAEAEADVCRRYLAGETSYQIGNIFGVSATAISDALKRNGIRLRRGSEAQGGLSPNAAADVCRRYENGESTLQLSAAFGVSINCICSVLERNGIARRSAIESHGGLSAACIEEVCRRYLAGENTIQLGDAFGVHYTSICNILERQGVSKRTPSEVFGGLSDKDQVEVCRRYLAGENSTTLGETFGQSITTICRILKRNGIERRESGGYHDSVQHILDGTGNHKGQRECCFYLFELARYSETHCKPGIAFDVDTRVDDEYGEEVLRLVFATRAEAYFLEQAVLDATCGSADCPDDLQDWGGATEIRAMPAQDMLPIVLRLADELDDLGMWEFAARYVPMTAAQRAQCQQRALQSVAVITEQEG